MQTARNRIGATILAACVLVALAFGGVYALAAGEYPAPGTNTLKVTATSSSDAAFVEDIATADVVVDVYKIAEGEPDATYVKYNYTFIDSFKDLNVSDDPTAEEWEAVAKQAATKVAAGTQKVGTVPADSITEFTLPDDGLYLLMPHGLAVTPAYGDDVLGSLAAYSASNGYVFTPSITAAPTKPADATGTIRTDQAAGEWTRDIEVTLKPQQTTLYGDLVISKTVDAFEGDEPAVFTFRITGTTPAGATYNNVATVSVSAAGTEQTTVTHIPAGTEVTVVEEYSGPGYAAQGPDEQTATIRANEAVALPQAFRNTLTEPVPGSGIENKFTYNEERGDWDWSHSPGEADATMGGGAQ